MLKRTAKRGPNFRSSLLLGAASLAVIWASNAALAQDQDVETIVVTGSRIPQTGLYSASPTTVVNSQELTLTGAVNTESLLSELPQQIGGETSGADLAGTGEEQVSLRNLGSDRTLVLVDGKRFAPSNLGEGNGNGGVDLDSIPSDMIDHVEVVTGGASAVYGSDAVAGVVNIILKKDVQGIELSGTYSEFTHGDGDTGDLNAILGMNSPDGKGNVTMYMGYTHSAPVWAKDRAWSAIGVASNGSKLIPYGSPSIPAGDFYLGSGPNTGKEYLATTAGTFTPDTEALFPNDPNYSQDFFNPDTYTEIKSRQERYDLGAEGHYDVGKQLSLYARVMYSDNQIDQQVAPVTTSYELFTVTGDNSYLSNQQKAILFGTPTPGATDVADIYLGKRLVQQGGRQSDFDFQNFETIVGAKGDLGGGWSYDVSAQYGRASTFQFFNNYTSETGLQEAISCGSPTAATAGCAGWNIFDINPSAPDQYDSAVRAETAETANLQTITQEQVVTGSLTGDLGSIGFQSPWAKSPVAVAIGAEYRQESGQVIPDETLINKNALGLSGAVPPTHGSYNVTEGFGELKIPLAQALPLFEDLDLDGGYRYSSYDTIGAVSTYKYGAEWSPTEDFKLRGLVQRAVRAPNIAELFTPDSISLFTLTQDPCTGATGNEEALCLATGAKPLQGGCPSGQCQDLIGGDAALKPETSLTKTLGIVLTPTFLDGFTATIDYYDINVTGAIGEFFGSPTTVLAACYAPAGGFTSVAAQAASAACQAVHRNSTGGFIGSGYVDAVNSNTATLHPTGIDVEVNYQKDLSDFGLGSDSGSIAWNFNGTRQLKFISEGSIASPTLNCAGLYGATCGAPDPYYRFNTRLTWASPDRDLLFSVRWRYIGSVELDTDKFTGSDDIPDHMIPSQSYFDISGIWTITHGVQLSAGVNNVFNRQPPVVDLSLEPNEDNTFPQTYDVTGAQAFANIQFKF